MSKILNVDCELTYDVSEQTMFMLSIAVPDGDSQTVRAESIVAGNGFGGLVVEQLQAPDSPNRLLRIDVPPGQFNIRYLANVEVNRPEPDRMARELPLGELPSDVVPFLTASRYCESDILFPVAVAQFGHLIPGFGRVEAICSWIRNNVEYRVGASHVLSTARDALANKAGVCRDFAHIAIAFCRALNIPARLVTGYAKYAEPPPDFHAVFEAYLGSQWILFDPTELSAMSDLVRIGTGRDASEVAFSTFFGQARLRYLSPLVELADASQAAHVLLQLQQPGAGIQLAA